LSDSPNTSSVFILSPSVCLSVCLSIFWPPTGIIFCIVWLQTEVLWTAGGKKGWAAQKCHPHLMHHTTHAEFHQKIGNSSFKQCRAVWRNLTHPKNKIQSFLCLLAVQMCRRKETMYLNLVFWLNIFFFAKSFIFCGFKERLAMKY